jgi:hypothetical protein
VRAFSSGCGDYQDGVPGRGDANVVAPMWFSIELQATTRIAQEEDMIVDADGKTRWGLRRQAGCSSWGADNKFESHAEGHDPAVPASKSEKNWECDRLSRNILASR